MPNRSRTRHNRALRDATALQRHALSQIPTPPVTVQGLLFSFFVNLWTTNRAFLLPGIYFKFPWSFPSVTFWFTSSYLDLYGRQHWCITLLGPASWPLQLQPQQWKRTICFSLHSNSCTALVHLSKDHPVQISSNGFGNTISTLYRDSLLSFRANIFGHCLIQDSKNPGSITLGQFWSNSCLEHPALLAGCVCVCTFSKEVKPVLGLCAFHMTNIWLVLEKTFTMRSSFTCASTFTFTPPWDFVSSIFSWMQ